MYQSIRELERDVRILLRNDGVAYGAKTEVIDALDEHRTTAARLGRDEPLRRHLQMYLRREHRRYTSDPDDDDDALQDPGDTTVDGATSAAADGGREEPLCDCRDPRCPLKRGNVPARALRAETLSGGLDDFLSSHSGSGAVVQEAREEWADMVAEYRTDLREAVHTLEEAAGGRANPKGA